MHADVVIDALSLRLLLLLAYYYDSVVAMDEFVDCDPLTI